MPEVSVIVPPATPRRPSAPPSTPSRAQTYPAGDAVTFAALARGSLEARAVVL